jgi:uncharacterized protein DUF4197
MTTTYVRSTILSGILGSFLIGSTSAAVLDGLTNQEAVQGLKGAISRGADTAIGKLGVAGGFMNNPKVKIPLPAALDKVAKGMRMMGRGKDADELVATMNQAAEQAVPAAKELLAGAVKTMSVQDAKKILTGGDGSVTRFFRDKTAAPLAVKFLPIVKRATDRVGLAQKYDQFAGQGTKLGLIKGDAANIEQYVTNRALDGLYLMIGEEEHTIRQNPAAAGSAIVSKVFGALR